MPPDGVVVVKLTGKPDEAVALTVTGDWARVSLARAAKEMAWPAAKMVKLRLTVGAALVGGVAGLVGLDGAGPGGEARRCREPPRARECTPEGVVVVKLTGKPDEAVALTMRNTSMGGGMKTVLASATR